MLARIRACRRGQAMVELALVLPLLLTVFIGGLVAGLAVDNKVIGAGAVAAGARVAGQLGDGTASPHATNQAWVDNAIVTAVLTQARSMPHASRIEIVIFPGSSGVLNLNGHHDRWYVDPDTGRPTPAPGEQTYPLSERAPQRDMQRDPNFIGVYMKWRYDPPAAGYATRIDMDELSIAPVLTPPPTPPPAPGHAIPRALSMPGGVTGHFYNKVSATDSRFDNPNRVTEYWTQNFSQLDFNPPAEANLGCSQNINVRTRPFTNLNPGNCTTVIAEGTHNGIHYRAGEFPPGSNDWTQFPVTFQAAFTGTLHVTRAGSYNMHIYSDDGFILGIGNGASSDAGRFWQNPPPGGTYLSNLPVLECWNDASSPAQRSFNIYFPTPDADYPFEIDYTETFAQDISLVFGSELADPIQGGGQ